MPEPSNYSCRCGQVALRVRPHSGTRAVCYCKHCRAFARLVGDTDTLDQGGGTDVVQHAPEDVTLVQGAGHLAAYRLTRKGPLRWYATCCGTRVANTGAARALPLVTIMTDYLDTPGDAGRLRFRAFPEQAIGPVPGDRGRVAPVALQFMARTLRSWVTFGFRRHPFFDAAGAPLTPPERPEGPARAAAYDDRAGPA